MFVFVRHCAIIYLNDVSGKSGLLQSLEVGVSAIISLSDGNRATQAQLFAFLERLHDLAPRSTICKHHALLLAYQLYSYGEGYIKATSGMHISLSYLLSNKK